MAPLIGVSRFERNRLFFVDNSPGYDRMNGFQHMVVPEDVSDNDGPSRFGGRDFFLSGPFETWMSLSQRVKSIHSAPSALKWRNLCCPK